MDFGSGMSLHKLYSERLGLRGVVVFPASPGCAPWTVLPSLQYVQLPESRPAITIHKFNFLSTSNFFLHVLNSMSLARIEDAVQVFVRPLKRL